MKYSRLERLYRERADSEDNWILSFCASHILGLAPLWFMFTYSWLTYPVYTILFTIAWKRFVLK